MKNIKNYFLTALLALTLVFGITGITTLTKASAETKLYANLNVGQDISLVISAEIPEAESVTATFAWMGKEDYSDIVVGEKQGETNVYKFFYRGLSAQYMAKDVTVTVYDGETKLAEDTVSVQSVLNTYLSSSAKALKINANAYKKLTTLSADILNYGKAAESYLGMTDDIGTVTGGSTFVADETATSAVQGNNGLKWNAGVIFDYNLRPAVKVYIPDSAEKTALNAKIDGVEAELVATETDNVYTLTYADYDILKLDNDYKFEVFDGETSLGSYTSTLAALAKESNAEIVKAAYVYGKSVVKYASVLEDIDFVSEHFQAEDVITGLESNNYKTGSGSWEYINAEGTKTAGSGTIATGVEGKFIENLSYNGSSLSSARWTIALKVTAPKTGEYDLHTMMQINNNIALKGKLRIAVKQGNEDVSDEDYVTSNTTDNCFPASQWSGFSGGWKNTYFWTDVSLGTIALNEGENTIYIAAVSATVKDIPNIDYFYVKGFTTKEDSIAVVNTRKAFSTSLTEQPVIGATEETAFVVKKGVELKELFKKNSYYVNNLTGLYMIIPNFLYDGHYQSFKVPVTEDMISGLNVDEAGIQKATITYKTYSTEVYFNVYESVIEAENNVFTLVNGAETETKYTRVYTKTYAQYWDGDTRKQTSVYNGFSGNGVVENLNDYGKTIYFKFDVIVPVAGNYNIKMRARASNDEISAANKFKININGQTDENGNLSFTTCTKSQQLYKGNRLSEYCKLNGKEYQKYYNVFWWNKIDLGSFELEEGKNVIRVYLAGNYEVNIDRFEVIYDDTTTSNMTAKTSIFSMRNQGVEESLDGKVLTIKKGVKLTDIVSVNSLHPATYTLLYMRLANGQEVPILGSMLEGKVDYELVGETQVITVKDPVSEETASFTLLIEE